MAIEDELHREVAGGKQRSERSPESPSFCMYDFGRLQHFSDYTHGCPATWVKAGREVTKRFMRMKWDEQQDAQLTYKLRDREECYDHRQCPV
jgi:hypothetical protein